MSTIKHREIDINLIDTDTYDEYFVERGALVDELQMRLDADFQGIAWVFNEQPSRVLIFSPNKRVVINLYDPFREGYRIR